MAPLNAADINFVASAAAVAWISFAGRSRCHLSIIYALFNPLK
jgi:hypothetical protein